MPSYTPDDFKLAFDTLTKSADRSRTTTYFFIVVNFSIFLVVLNNLLFSIPAFRLGQYVDQINCVVSKKYTDDCKLRDDIYGRENIQFHFSNTRLPANFDINTIAQEFTLDRLKVMTDSQYSDSRYAFPILCISADIDYIWLISSFVGVF
jgi:hypothetical protein